MGNTPQRRGLRILIGLAGLFSIFGLAALWQSKNIEKSRAIRDNAPDVLTSRELPVLPEDLRPTFPQGWGRIVLGVPSGAPATARAVPVNPTNARPEVDDQGDTPSIAPPPLAPAPRSDLDSPPPSLWPQDQELIVRSGQSLSKIIATAYGRSTQSLVERLATYNGMENSNKLRIGQTLRIPTLEKLNELLPE